MKALIRKSNEAGQFYFEETEKPTIEATEALIRIKAVGVCGTDYHMWKGELSTIVPLIPGHELCGIVEDVGKKVTNVKPGDKVVSRLNIDVCGICRMCLTGNAHMCVERRCPGFKIQGAYAEYIAIDANQLIKLTDGVSFEEGAFVEPMAIVTHALLERTKIEPEDKVVIFGPGPIGLIAAQMVRIYGASKVVVVGIESDYKIRMALASHLGVDYLLNSQSQDVESEIMKITEGKGADIVIETSGSEQCVNIGLKILRNQGRMCVLGLPSKHESVIDWLTACEKSLAVVFSYSSSPWSWEIATSLLKRGGINIKRLITHTYPLSSYMDMFEEMGKGNVVKGIFLP